MSERKQREFERRELEILDATLALCDSEQWESVTVAQIASQAGIGKGTVYKHFASKEEICARLVLDDAAELMVQLRHHAEQFDDPVAWARDMFHFIFNWSARRNVLSRMHNFVRLRASRERLSDDTQQQLTQMDNAFFELLSPPILRGMEQGVFAKRPVNQLFTGLHATFHGVLLMIRNREYAGCGVQGAQNEQEFIDDMVEFMVSILAGPAATATE